MHAALCGHDRSFGCRLACPIKIQACVRAGLQLRPPDQVCQSRCWPFRGGYHRQPRLRDRVERFWIWRGYCRRCDQSHVLPPDFVVPPRRHDRHDLQDPRPSVLVGFPAEPAVAGRPASTAAALSLRSAIASNAVGFGGERREVREDRLLVALWCAVRRASKMIPLIEGEKLLDRSNEREYGDK